MKTILLITLFLLSISAFAQKAVIIVNSTNGVSQITKNQLQDFFFKRSRMWSDGSPVRFFDHSDTDLRKSFLQKFIRMTPRQVDQFWIAQKFSSGDSAPTQVSSDSMIMNMVSRFPGGIGYVREGTTLSKNVKIIEVTEL